MAKGSVRNSR